MNTALNAVRRRTELSEVAAGAPLDVIVIGGGITGVGVALDAATRGLKVALLERADLASGTSSWSSKLVHGGLRYLASGAVGIAMESAQERRILMERTAPHLVHPLALIIPLTPSVTRSEAFNAGVGGRLGDVLRIAARTSRTTLPRALRLSAAETTRQLPGVRTEGLRGGLVTFDGQLEDDARLVIGLARTAAGHGARILTRCSVVSVNDGRVSARDELTGESFELAATHVVNATGVWANDLAPEVHLRPSKGSHVVVTSESVGNPTAALAVPVPGERARYVFALPQPDGVCLIGLTDDPLAGPIPDLPPVLDGEVAFLLSTLNEGLRTALTERDVVGRFAGLRPLLDTGEGETADLSRKHAVLEREDRMLTIVGGKLTTYRRMAQDVVDRIAQRPGVTSGPCRTTALPIVGSGANTSTSMGVSPRLVRRYGSEAATVEALSLGDPTLAEPVAPGVPTVGVEFAWGISHEAALTAEDLVDRRARLDFVDSWRAAALPLAEKLISNS